MTEFDNVLLPTQVAPFEPALAPVLLDGEVILSASAIAQIVPGGDSILQNDAGGEGDDWILLLQSTASSDALAGGIVGLADEAFLLNLIANPEEEEEQVITITGHEGGGGGATGGGSDSGYTGSDGMGSGGTGGTGVTPVEPHTQDCGSEDGAAVQVARHVMGTTLPVGVAGPEDAVTTSSGNEWTKVEFGALIVKNPDGTFGAFNNMIYSNDANGWVALPMTGVQGFQGTWHNHPARVGDLQQQAIDRYPSRADWAELASLAKQPGAASDPSIWLTGPDGVTREFKLSERGQFDHDNTDPMKKGEGLDGRERTASCG